MQHGSELRLARLSLLTRGPGPSEHAVPGEARSPERSTVPLELGHVGVEQAPWSRLSSGPRTRPGWGPFVEIPGEHQALGFRVACLGQAQAGCGRSLEGAAVVSRR